MSTHFCTFSEPTRRKDGHLELDLRWIRTRYLKTWFIPNFLAILPYTLGFYIVGKIVLQEEETTEPQQRFLIFITIGDVFSLVRLYRVKAILASSDSVIDFRQKHNNLYQIFFNVFLLVVCSHWFACIWAFIAILEARSYAEGLTERPNWIGSWYESNFVEEVRTRLVFKIIWIDT